MTRDILRGLAILLAGIVLATAAMIGVYMLPVDRMHANLAGAAHDLPAEGLYPRLIASSAASQLDDFTDALILSEVIYDGPRGLLDRAMNVYSPQGSNPTIAFTLAYNGASGDRWWTYSRYWHGYLAFLKPFFMIFSYDQFRSINGICQFLLIAWTAWLLFRKGLGKYIAALILAYLALYPPALGMSMQFSPCFYISMLAVCVILRSPTDCCPFRIRTIFLLTGMATSFFDFLTYPLATWGLPMVAYILLQKRTGWPMYREILWISAFWCLGYAGMWAGKWVVASLLTGENTFANGLAAVLGRTSWNAYEGGHNGAISLIDIYKRQIWPLWENTGFVILAASAVAVLFVRGMRRGGIPALLRMPALLPLAGTAIAPFVWYAVASNHSFVHFWFTFRALSVSVFAGSCLLIRWSDGPSVPEQ